MDNGINAVPEVFYKEQEQKYRIEYQGLKRKSRWLTFVRLALFLAAFAFLFAALFYENSFGYLIAGISGALFFVVIKKWNQVNKQLQLLQRLLHIQSMELSAINHQVEQFPTGNEFSALSHDFASDVDVFGSFSLFQYVNRAVTSEGKKALAFLFSESDVNKIEYEGRKNAVNELTNKPVFRHYFLAKLQETSQDEKGIDNAISWSEKNIWPAISKYWKFIILIVSLVSGLFLLALWNNLIPFSGFLLWTIVPLGITGMFHKTFQFQHHAAAQSMDAYRKMADAFKEIESTEFHAKKLLSLQAVFSINGNRASKAIAEIDRILSDMDARGNPISYLLLNIFFCWDVKQLLRLQEWKKNYAPYLQQWLLSSAQFEALSSLGAYNFNHPKNCHTQFKEVLVLNALQLHHPLLPINESVGNDFVIPKTGTIVILTGANMAGKSTFLRTVALNYILAANGCTVPAEVFEFSPVSLITSMRTTDSLAKHESYFFTELKRLQKVLHTVGEKQNAFVILDEMLKGTNSKDKAEGSWLFLEKLRKLGGTGIVATHDLSICQLAESYPETFVNMSFDVQIFGAEVSFDYKLKAEVCKHMNASILMKNLGLVDA